MKFLPVQFKGKQVWAEASEDGRLAAAADGKLTIVYALGGKAYSTVLDRVRVVAGAQPEEGPDPLPGDSGPGRPAPGKKKAGSSDAEVFGGGARDLLDPQAIHLWTDGACSGNPGPAGSGLVLLDGPRRLEISAWLGEGTNNIAELTAILLGLRELARPVTRAVVVHTDSQYGIGVLARSWKAKANVELIAEIKRELRGIPRVVWHWVRGHQGVALNERCDALARQAIARRGSGRLDVGEV